MAVALRGGHVPARWMPDAAYGYGYPFWNYYAPLPFYVAAGLALAGMGIVESIKAVQLLGFLGAAWGMYRLATEVLDSRPAAVLAAVAYTYAPFHLVNVYVRGDSLGEFVAFAFYPLVLLGLHRLRHRPEPRSVAWTALAYAGLVLTHNISALIFTPFALLYAVVLWFSPQSPISNTQSPSYSPWTLAALTLGLALSAFYWIPALLERSAVQLEQNLTGYFHYAGHFRGANLVQRSLLVNYAVDAAGTPFAMGFAQALLGLAGLLAIVVLAARSTQPVLRRSLLFFPLTVLAATFLITPASRPLWDRLPLLPFVQFPWRWLSVQALGLAVSIGALACLPRRRTIRWGVALLAGGLLALTALADLPVAYLPLRDGDATPQRLMLYELFTGNIGSTVRAEYLPRAVNPRPWTSSAVRGEPMRPIGAEEATLLERGPASQRWRVRVATAREVVFPTYWFPGWRATVDGHPVETTAQPGHGGVRLRLPAGEHEVRLWLGRTRVRLVAELLSLLGGLVLLGLMVRSLLPLLTISPWPPVIAIVVTLSLALLLVSLPRLLSAPVDGPLSMDFDRMPYLHPNPDGVRWPGGVTLRRYTLAPESPSPGQTLEVEMTWSEGRPGVEAELALVSPAAVLFHVPDVLATARRPLQPVTTFRLPLPMDVNPGVYLLRLRLFDAPDTLSGGTVYLRPVSVRERPSTPIGKPVVAFGEVAYLADTRVTQVSATQLQVDLTWEARQPMAANYATSVRLQDAQGNTVATVDTQPCYGFCPTSLWSPDQVVHDRRWLTLPEGTSPGNDYRLEIVLYEAATLQPVGTARIDGVALTQPTVRRNVTPKHRFGGLTIVDARLERDTAEPGERIPVTLRWWLQAPVTEDLQVRLVLQDGVGQPVYEQVVPVAPGFGTSRWPEGALVERSYVFRLPRELPPGEYGVGIGVVGFDSTFDPGFRLQVTPSTRVFEPPALPRRLDVTFGDEIRLVGYELQQDRNALSLLVAWQALRDLDRDYKVFVHLFDPTTERIVAQRDVEPRGGDRPTSTWIAGEVVTDGYHIGIVGLPPGNYRLAIGLYDPVTGQRLAAVPPDGQRLPDDRVVLEKAIRIGD